MMKECRICYSSKEYFVNKLISPCKCKGSMAYIHQYCLYKYFPQKYCNICNSNFCEKIYFILDLVKNIFTQFFIILYCYVTYLQINLLKCSIILIIFLETIMILYRVCKMIFTFFDSFILLLCIFYQMIKTSLIIYFLFLCNDHLCYPVFTLLLYIQINIILQIYNISKYNYLY